ncbi:MAG: ATP-binding protein [Actinomycetota bacterium]
MGRAALMDTQREIVLLVVSPVAETRDRLQRDLLELVGGAATVGSAASAADAAALGRGVMSEGGVVPVAFLDFDLHPEGGADALVRLHDDGALPATRTVVVTKSTSLHGVDRALRSGALHGMVTAPWSTTGLREMLEAQLATHLVEHAPELLDRFDHLLDQHDRERAEQRVAQRRAAPDRIEQRTHPLLDDSHDDEVESELVAALDRALGHPPRIRISPGTTMIESGDDVGGIYVVLSGVVRLTSTTDDGEVILHERSTGAIIGLLSLASRRRALLTCTSVTDVLAIPVTLEQLARAVDVDPTVGSLLNRVLIASLARRLRRSDELQAELDRSLAALSEARAQLVANARFTTLGELSAGMAHELNNPAAALQRAIDHIGRDTSDLLAPDDAEVVHAAAASTSTEPSTSERRALRREIARHFDARLAERLIGAGADDLASATELAARTPDELERLTTARRLGTTLRDAERAAHRVQSLVDSLRSYARGDDGRGTLVNDVDVERTIDSALRLVAHRIGEISVEREQRAELPPIVGRPGALQHVWTNLITNALEAATGDGSASGTLVLRTDAAPGRVVVEVEDDGPGIPADLLERIFEPRFTTKQGRVSFGLGLGLSIARQIVGDHDGTIGVERRGDRTVFRVELPIESATDVDASPERPGFSEPALEEADV